MVRDRVPVFEFIVNEPEFTPAVKSPATAVPELVQYKVVPSNTSLVVIVHVTLPPSLTEVVLGDTE